MKTGRLENVELSALIDILRRELPDLHAVYLFGSAATGDLRPESDVDLAVLLPSILPPLRRWEIQETLAATLGRNVDLVDLRSASTVLKAQIITTGVVAYDPAWTERAFFEATQLSAYARLQEERRGILEDIHARGSIHG